VELVPAGRGLVQEVGVDQLLECPRGHVCVVSCYRGGCPFVHVGARAEADQEKQVPLCLGEAAVGQVKGGSDAAPPGLELMQPAVTLA
jgi:hypothetical protein